MEWVMVAGEMGCMIILVSFGMSEALGEDDDYWLMRYGCNLHSLK